MRMMEAEDFISMVSKRFNVKCFVAGTDCRFGHNRVGDHLMLEKLALKYGYECKVVKKLQYEGEDISSTRIRNLLEEGNLEKANILLGYPYFVMGEIKDGRKLGRTIGFPTINLIPEKDKLLPPNGVYATKIVIDDVTYRGMTNVGYKPTVEGKNLLGIETNIFDFHEDVYGKTALVRFEKFMRPEKKFPSLEALRNAIEQDKNEITDFFN